MNKEELTNEILKKSYMQVKDELNLALPEIENLLNDGIHRSNFAMQVRLQIIILCTTKCFNDLNKSNTEIENKILEKSIKVIDESINTISIIKKAKE